jgi:hypothetical protein
MLFNELKGQEFISEEFIFCMVAARHCTSTPLSRLSTFAAMRLNTTLTLVAWD